MLETTMYYALYLSVLEKLKIGPTALRRAILDYYDLGVSGMRLLIDLKDINMGVDTLNLTLKLLAKNKIKTTEIELDADEILSRLGSSLFTIDGNNDLFYRVISIKENNYVQLEVRRNNKLWLAFSDLSDFIASKTDDFTEVSKFHEYLKKLDSEYDSTVWVSDYIYKEFFSIHGNEIDIVH